MLKNTLTVLAVVLAAGAGLLPFSGEPRTGDAVAAEPVIEQPASAPATEPAVLVEKR